MMRLNRKLTLEAPQRLADGMGGYVETWAALGTLWGEVKPASGAERGGVGGPLARVRLKITLRAAPYGAPSRPKPEQRLRDGARIYSVLAVEDSDPRGRYLTVIAQEEVQA